jgi:putative Mn2+ efflux pump MntP
LDFFTLLITAVALSMDAVAVAIASGLSVKQVRLREALLMATMFGLFQGGMPVAGYALGAWMAGALQAFDHWIAFVLLAGLGLKMIWESREAGEERIHSPFRFNKIIVLAVATSIDAFAVGIGFAVIDVGLTQTALVIGVTTFLLCLPAAWFGCRLGQGLGKLVAQRAEVLGGVVLIAIGSKILIEHLHAGI